MAHSITFTDKNINKSCENVWYILSFLVSHLTVSLYFTAILYIREFTKPLE